MFASTRKRCVSDVDNQPTTKRIIKSSSYEDFSPSLLAVDTQPYDETIEEKKELKFTPSYSPTRLETREASWMDISANRRVRTIITPFGTLKMEFRMFLENEPTEKGIFINEQQWKEFKQHLPKLEFAFSSFLSYGEESAYRVDLGNLHYTEFDPRFPCVQLRRYYVDKKNKNGKTYSSRYHLFNASTTRVKEDYTVY